MPLPRVLRDLLALPTASFAESAVMDHVAVVCGGLPGVQVRRDRYGNLSAHYRRGRRSHANPVVFAAHTDHPGFVAQEMVERRTLRAAFRGGVLASYFPGTRVRFYTSDEVIPARVEHVTKARKLRRGNETWEIPLEARLRVARPVPPRTPGMWALPEARERNGRVYARACDDIAGCAAMVALLERLSRKRATADVCCLFTRAEEVGFIGAIGAARAGSIPRDVPLVAIETSSELPDARIGDGPILRVGDRMSVFDPAATAFCDHVAQELAQRRKSFRFQRKLMDGGSCESTAYCAYGYRATGICLALGNYHNMDKRRGRIAPEYVSLSDWKLMVDWFEAVALARPGSHPGDESIRDELEQSFAKWSDLLES